MSKLRAAHWCNYLLLAAIAFQSGCGLAEKIPPGPHDTRTSYHDTTGLKIEYPQVSACSEQTPAAAVLATAPHAFEDPSQLPAWEMPLEQAIQLAVGTSPTLRTLGATVVDAPQAITTIYDPALAHSNPLLGVEAALSEFDAQYNGQLFWSKVDQPSNVTQGGLGAQFNPVALQETRATYISELSKQSAQGGRYALRKVVDYNRSNRPFRQFPSDFVGFLEAEWRQPLMRGAGTYYNQIAGPNAQIGQYNGVLIARINEDVSLADFEAAVIDLVAEVEQAYWNLYQSYRLLEASLRGRESALQSFQFIATRRQAGAATLGEEAQAQSQFFQFQALVQNALAGPNGLYAAEQELRYLLGLPATDGQLIKPSSEPTHVQVVFDWDSALSQALTRRVEVRRQKWNIKRRELELVAARLNRRPQLDFLGQYRWRGLGDHLIGDREPGQPLDNLASSITGGDYQEWQAGLELSFPVGLRAASNAVANARLNVARERSLLNETELRISHDLSDAARELIRAKTLLETNYQRWQSDLQQVEVLAVQYREGLQVFFELLVAQRQVTNSESDFYLALTEYNLAIRDLHRQKGTLLPYNHVALNEGPWAAGAMQDAYQRGRFFTPHPRPESIDTPPPVSAGPFDPSQPAPWTSVPDASPEMLLDSDPDEVTAPDVISRPLPEAVNSSGGETLPQVPLPSPARLPLPPVSEDGAASDAADAADAEQASLQQLLQRYRSQ